MSNDKFRTAEVRTALRHSSLDILEFFGSKSQKVMVCPPLGQVSHRLPADRRVRIKQLLYDRSVWFRDLPFRWIGCRIPGLHTLAKNRSLTIDYTDFYHPALSGGLYTHVGGRDRAGPPL